jgi:plasmid stabilization system protein ParE
MKIFISQSADRDLLEGYRFYERQCEGVGDYFLDSLMAEIDSLVLYAGMHRRVESYYRVVCRTFPFAMFYRLEDDRLCVLRVLDCRRNPAWIHRQLKRSS